MSHPSTSSPSGGRSRSGSSGAGHRRQRSIDLAGLQASGAEKLSLVPSAQRHDDLVLTDLPDLPAGTLPAHRVHDYTLIQVRRDTYDRGLARDHLLANLRVHMTPLRHLTVYMDQDIAAHEGQRRQLIAVFMAVLTQHRREICSVVYDVPRVVVSPIRWPVMPKLKYLRTSRVCSLNFLTKKVLRFPDEGLYALHAEWLQVLEARVESFAMHAAQYFWRQIDLQRITLSGTPSDLLQLLEQGILCPNSMIYRFSKQTRIALITHVPQDYVRSLQGHGLPSSAQRMQPWQVFVFQVWQIHGRFNHQRVLRDLPPLPMFHIEFLQTPEELASGRLHPPIFDRYDPMGQPLKDVDHDGITYQEVLDIMGSFQVQ